MALKPRLTIGAATHAGCSRAQNEDCFRHLWIGDDCWAAVADGCGGEAAGEVAARIAIDSFSEHLAAHIASGRDVSFLVREAVVTANRCVLAEAEKPGHKGMATTFSGIYLHGRTIVSCHVGDSRICRWRDGRLEVMTEDHTWVAGEVKAGRLTAQAAAKHPRASWLVKALGMKDFVAPDMDISVAWEGDQYLLASDGLFRCLKPAEIGGYLATEPQESVERLIDETLARGAPDNVTVVLVRVDGYEEAGG